MRTLARMGNTTAGVHEESFLNDVRNTIKQGLFDYTSHVLDQQFDNASSQQMPEYS